MVVAARFLPLPGQGLSHPFEVEPSKPTTLKPGATLSLVVTFHAPDFDSAAANRDASCKFRTQLVIGRRVLSPFEPSRELKSTLGLVGTLLVPPALRFDSPSLVWTPREEDAGHYGGGAWERMVSGGQSETWLSWRQTLKVWNDGAAPCRVEGEILGGGGGGEAGAVFVFDDGGAAGSSDAVAAVADGHQHQHRSSFDLPPGQSTVVLLSCR